MEIQNRIAIPCGTRKTALRPILSSRRAAGRRFAILRAPLTGLLISIFACIGCDFPYSPQKQPRPDNGAFSQDSTPILGAGRLYTINGNFQACNPSISQNPSFPACMLWLNLDQVSVTVPDSLSGYSTRNVESHDRLTITDTANTVRWYMMRGEIETKGELQCPEWSTHADYIACLVGVILSPYSGFAVRISDKKTLKICNNSLAEFSAPHFWLPDSARPGIIDAVPAYDTAGFVTKDFVQRFFGTVQFKFVSTVIPGDGTLSYVDYSLPGDPAPVQLPKPKGKENAYCASPLISPDGNWVAYHCFKNSSQGNYYSSYIQRLRPGSTAVLIAEGASDPHWWVDPYSDRREYFIVYTMTKGKYQTDYDFADPTVEAGALAGATCLQPLAGSVQEVPDFLQSLAIDATSQPRVIARLPFKGGLSQDGRFLCTSYTYSYIMKMKGTY